MKNIYLLLAIIGAVIPYLFYIQFMQVEGLNFSLFITQIFANKAASGFTADVLLATVVFWCFIFQRAKSSSAPKPLVFFVLSCTVGLSCALPAYLYANEN
ncbi:hypothetical protein tinsulaeT_06660 [Thalassotalea insulae]|uniref:DUF2834 domain-containing protein n=1 Tax=Thalassotalea insulae TaxID=2056778 RepID=A0ABQ6GRK7_9GAMM|nr:DUF2834 domain-containing protein [Thalassotalea insulae]GLX77326.1 hypothetical protein tinsulaeT_06660 [Thalassotalea insulae]